MLSDLNKPDPRGQNSEHNNVRSHVSDFQVDFILTKLVVFEENLVESWGDKLRTNV